MVEMAGRELLMASKLETYPVLDKGGYKITIQASESGSIDLSRLQLSAFAHFSTDQKNPKEPVDVLFATTIKELRVLSTLSLVRGENPVAPAVLFSPFRQYGAIQPGVWRLEAGNLIEIELDVDPSAATLAGPGSSGKAHFSFAAAVPFEPANRRDLVPSADFSTHRGTYVGSSTGKSLGSVPYKLEDKLSGYLVRYELNVTFDQTGMVDLSSLQLMDTRGPQTDEPSLPVVPLPGSPKASIATTIVSSILLPTREELIVGELSRSSQVALAAPAAIFSSFGRRFDWVNFGLLDVANGNTVTITFCYFSPKEVKPDKGYQRGAALQFVAGLQFYPRR